MMRCTFLIALGLGLMAGSRGLAESPVALREAFPVDYQYHVSTRTSVSGRLTLPPEKGRVAKGVVPVTGESAIEYDEKILDVAGDRDVRKTLRVYRRVDFQRKVAGQPQESTIRPEVRRLVLLRLANAEVPFSPDGPLQWGEIDLVRTDVFTPALAGLLPERPVVPGARWTAAAAAVQELTDLERIEEGQVECRFEQLTDIEGRRHARVSFAGTVRGVNEDGPNKQQIEGYLLFDLVSNHVSYLWLKGVTAPLDKDGKEQGKVEGQFVLTRRAHTRAPDLDAAALRQIKLEPDDDNTQLAYDNPDLGIRFLYPRRWHVAGVHGRQVAVDDPAGNGILLTVEPAGQVPTAAQFQAEARDWLQKQKARVLRADGVRRIESGPRELDNFFVDAELAGQRVVLDYYVLRQATGGVTMTARLLTRDLATVRRQAERIARSVTVGAAK